MEQLPVEPAAEFAVEPFLHQELAAACFASVQKKESAQTAVAAAAAAVLQAVLQAVL